MTPDDPILAAETVSQMMRAIDERYKLKLPWTMPPGTKLAELWASPIHVSKDPTSGVLYQATGDTSIQLAIFSTTVLVRVEGADHSTNRGSRPVIKGAEHE